MSDRILLVDDDKNLLAACERNLRRQFQLDTAEGGEAGLAKMVERGPYAVVVADRQMPGMDGITFLAEVRHRAPDTVRIMLTGNADLEAAIRVVNEGNIFRFLTKPCPPEVLVQGPGGRARTTSARHRRKGTAQQDPERQHQAAHRHPFHGGTAVVWPRPNVARCHHHRDGSLACHECLGNPPGRHAGAAWVHHRSARDPGPLARQPASAVGDRIPRCCCALPETTARLLANIPRLEGVARIVRYQHKRFDGSGFPEDALLGDSLPLGSRLLKILLDMMDIQVKGRTRRAALDELETRRGPVRPRRALHRSELPRRPLRHRFNGDHPGAG